MKAEILTSFINLTAEDLQRMILNDEKLSPEIKERFASMTVKSFKVFKLDNSKTKMVKVFFESDFYDLYK
jgi:hypothetical protein